MRNLSIYNNGQDRFEIERKQFHQRVRDGYLELAGKNKKRFIVIDATQPLEAMERDISNHIMPLIHGHEGQD